MQFTLSELWSHMGLFARMIVGVMGIMSLASLFVASERLLTFRKARKSSRVFLQELAPLLTRRDIEGAAAMPLEGESGYVGRVLAAGLKAYRVSPKADADLSFELVARALERQTERETQNMKRGQSLLATVSSTAPFVGLLGTVMGIVNSFQQMAASGSGGLATVSAGISEALVTTAFGLLVAIPAVMIFNYFQSVMEAVTVDISESANELLDVVATQGKARPGAELWPAA
jgi:biopolymer transport protein ExbB/biopolymer transport protein TolQ